MKNCSFEPEANAVKLLDVHDVRFDIFYYSGEIRIKTERRVRIKIFNERGYEHATIRVPYLDQKKVARLKDFKAVIINVDEKGKVQSYKLKESDFFREKAINALGVLTFTFPGLKPGSIIEYSYSKIEKNILKMDPWIIQGEIPVMYSSYSIITPNGTPVFRKVFGTDEIGSTNWRKGLDYSVDYFFKGETRAFKHEPFMTSAMDNISRVVFFINPQLSFINSMGFNRAIWKLVGKYIMEMKEFGGQMKVEIPGTAALIDSAKKIHDFKEKIGFLYKEVNKRLAKKPRQTFYPEDVVEAWQSETANSAEINIILINLLRKSGVKCHPLLISTRDNGKIAKDFPSFAQLNGVDAVAVDTSGFYILDASQKNYSYLVPPMNILNREAYLLESDSLEWVTITDDRTLHKQITSVFAEIDNKGILNGEASSQYYDYARTLIMDTTESEAEKKSGMETKTQGLTITNVSTYNEQDITQPLMQSVTFKYEVEKTGDYYFINPYFLGKKSSNPFSAETRNSDIDLGSKQEYILTLELTIPNDFVPDHLPSSKRLLMPDSSLSIQRTVSFANGILSFKQIFLVNKSLFKSAEYESLKDFHNKMYTLLSEQIILKRK